MKIKHEVYWRVYWIEALRQWTVLPPDGYYRNGEWVYLTNVHPTYWPTQAVAWNIAVSNAKKDRGIAALYFKHKSAIRLKQDYRPHHETLQAAEH